LIIEEEQQNQISNNNSKINTKMKKSLLLSLALSLIIFSCKKDGDDDGIKDDDDNCPALYNPEQEDADNDGIGDECDDGFTANDDDKLGENTIVIRDQDWENYIQDIDTINNTFTFSNAINNGQGFKVGDIIVGTEDGGYLRKVTGVTESGGEIIIETEFASMTDAVEKGSGSFSYQGQVDTESEEFWLADGIVLNPGKTQDLSFGADVNFVLFDGDENHETTHDQIKATGELSLDLLFDGDIDIDNFSVEYLQLEYGFDELIDLEFQLPIAGTTLHKELPIAHLPLGTWTFTVGVPVVIEPVLELNLVADVVGSTSIKASYKSEHEKVFSKTFQNGGWTNDEEIIKTLDADLLDFAGDVELEVGLESNLTFKVYRVVGATVGAEYKFQAGVSGSLSNLNIEYEMEQGIYLVGGVEAEIFGNSLFEYEHTFFSIIQDIDAIELDLIECTFTSLQVSQSPYCDNDFVNFELSCIVNDASGDYEIYNPLEPNVALVSFEDQVQTGELIFPISIPAPNGGTSIALNIRDANETECHAEEDTGVSLPSCNGEDCSVYGLSVLQAPYCDNGFVNLELSFNVLNTTGIYYIKNADTDETLTTYNGTSNGLITTTVSIASPDFANSLNIVIEDGNTTCSPSNTISVILPSCSDCSLNNFSIGSSPVCENSTVQFEVGMDITNGSGFYSVYNTETNEILAYSSPASIMNGSLVIPIEINNVESETTISINVQDDNIGTCLAGEPLQVILPGCSENNTIPIDIEWLFVEGGTFDMGCDDCGQESATPAHPVVLSDFYLSQFEITNIQFVEYLNSLDNVDENGFITITNESIDTTFKLINIDASSCKIYYGSNEFQVESGWATHPVVHINWISYSLFCNAIGGRLPTEAEWEYTALGGMNSNNYDYSGSNDIEDVSWHLGNSNNEYKQVGLKDPNELNFYDMSGNVAEWCQDWYNTQYYFQVAVVPSVSNIDPQGPEGYQVNLGTVKVVRGASYFDVWSLHKSRRRASLNWTQFGGNIGCRCAKDF